MGKRLFDWSIVRPRFTYANVAATLALAMATTGVTPATAVSLITGAGIKDNSVASRDITNGSIAVADLAPTVRRSLSSIPDGSVTTLDLSPSVRDSLARADKSVAITFGPERAFDAPTVRAACPTGTAPIGASYGLPMKNWTVYAAGRTDANEWLMGVDNWATLSPGSSYGTLRAICAG